MTDDQIAALDCRWESFPANEQAALKVTRKLTLTPQSVGEQDIADLKQHFSDREIIDIITPSAALTRSIGGPRRPEFRRISRSVATKHSPLDTPTSAEFASITSTVIPTNMKPRPLNGNRVSKSKPR